jgi:hypothetical protein
VYHNKDNEMIVCRRAALLYSNRNWSLLKPQERDLVFALQDSGYLTKKKKQDGLTGMATGKGL